MPRPSAVSICTVPFSRAEHALHYIQSHAAARQFGDLFGGGESRLKDQIQSLGLGQTGGLVGFQQSLGEGALPDLFRIDAVAVVGDLDDHLVALVISAQPQGTLRPLAGANPLLGGLNAMADGIAHHVGEGLGDRIQNAFVEIGLPAPDRQLDFFAALQPDVAHNAREAAEQLIDRHHANLHDRVLQVIQNPRLEGHGIGESSAQDIFREAFAKFQQRLLEHRFRQDEFTDQIENAVDSFRIHAQNVVRAGGHGGRRQLRGQRRLEGSGRRLGGLVRRRRDLVLVPLLVIVLAFRIGCEGRRERARWRRDAQGRDSDFQRDGWNAAFRPDLVRRFLRRQRRFDAVHRLDTAFERIESQHLAQSAKGDLDHLPSGDGHGALGVDLHHHVMNALALGRGPGDCQLLVFRPAAGFRGCFCPLRFRFDRAARRRTRQTGNVGA